MAKVPVMKKTVGEKNVFHNRRERTSFERTIFSSIDIDRSSYSSSPERLRNSAQQHLYSTCRRFRFPTIATIRPERLPAACLALLLVLVVEWVSRNHSPNPPPRTGTHSDTGVAHSFSDSESWRTRTYPDTGVAHSLLSSCTRTGTDTYPGGGLSTRSRRDSEEYCDGHGDREGERPD